MVVYGDFVVLNIFYVLTGELMSFTWSEWSQVSVVLHVAGQGPNQRIKKKYVCDIQYPKKLFLYST